MKNKSKLLFMFLVLCFMLNLQAKPAFADDEAIMVNGSNILLAPDLTVSCGNGTAKYNTSTRTLTLKDAAIGSNSDGDPLTYGIQILKTDVTVELIGTNTINAHFGIDSRYPFSIEGTSGSKLTTYAAQCFSGIPCRGIFTENGGLTVRNANLQFVIGDISDTNYYAIDIRGNDNLISNSRLEIVSQANPDSESKITGINAQNAASLTISDNSSIIMNSIDAGIAVTGNLKFSGSSLKIEEASEYAISSDSLQILEASELTVTAASYPALAANNKITISNSSVNVISKQTNAVLCTDLEITNSSKLTAKGYWPSLYVNHETNIQDSVVEAETENDVGIFCKGPTQIQGSDIKAVSNSQHNGIRILGDLILTDSKVISPGITDKDSIYATGNISITNGTTEIGTGSISAEKDIYIGGTITSNGVPAYENIKNNNGEISFAEADYSAVDAAIAKAEALNREDYINFETLETAINAVIRGKDIREQAAVDGYAAAIEEAIAALEPVPGLPNTYNIIEGADQTILTSQIKSVTIKADGDLNKFAGVSVDGNQISDENYTLAEGSTIITFKPEYIKTLTAGSHTVTIHYSDGQVQTTLTIKEDTPITEENGNQNSTQTPAQNQTPSSAQNQKNPEKTSPRTGDYASIGWLLSLIFSFIVILVFGKYKIRLLLQ